MPVTRRSPSASHACCATTGARSSITTKSPRAFGASLESRGNRDMNTLKLASAVAAAIAALAAVPAHAEELVIWSRTNQPAEDKALKQIISQFEAATPGVTVKMETRSVDEHKSALRIAATSKAGPDIYYLWAGFGLGGEFVTAGLSAPLDDYYKQYKRSDRLRPLADGYTNLCPPH